jgi:hypothetical protein
MYLDSTQAIGVGHHPNGRLETTPAGAIPAGVNTSVLDFRRAGA